MRNATLSWRGGRHAFVNISTNTCQSSRRSYQHGQNELELLTWTHTTYQVPVTQRLRTPTHKLINNSLSGRT